MMRSVQGWLATGPPGPLSRSIYYRIEQLRWRSDRQAGPAPHLLKERVVKRYARDFGLKTFVETGTYLGDMVAAVRGNFDVVHTVELDDRLYARAVHRFSRHPDVHLYRGDSGKLLPQILGDLDRPALFWLDAHYSGGVTARGDAETPVLDEIEHIYGTSISGHVVLIDDARKFTGSGGYPTVEQLETRIGGRPLRLEVADDIIRVTPAPR